MTKGNNLFLRAALAFSALALSAMTSASPNGGPLGDFEAHGDVGSPAIAGYAAYNAASQVYMLSAGGVNIWAKRDEFQFAYRRMKGDFIVQARVAFVGTGKKDDLQYYLDRPRAVGDAHGQAPMLWSATALLR